VERSSATLGYHNEGSSHIHGDHHSICKFATRDDPGYQTIRKLLVRIFSNIDPAKYQQNATTKSSSVPPGERNMSKQKMPTSKDISRLLGLEDTTEDYVLYLRDIRVVEYSCQWISAKETYIWWRASTGTSETRYMWLKAPPGAGKSVLMGYIVDQLRSDGQECNSYFFKIQNAVKRTARAFMLSMIAQSAKSDPKVFEKLVELEADDVSIRSMSDRILWQKVFVEILFESTHLPKSFWVLDGLDEAEKPGEVISLIGRIPATYGTRVLIASRPDIDIERGLHRLE
jgi:hypothetical protein